MHQNYKGFFIFYFIFLLEWPQQLFSQLNIGFPRRRFEISQALHAITLTWNKPHWCLFWKCPVQLSGSVGCRCINMTNSWMSNKVLFGNNVLGRSYVSTSKVTLPRSARSFSATHDAVLRGAKLGGERMYEGWGVKHYFRVYQPTEQPCKLSFTLNRHLVFVVYWTEFQQIPLELSFREGWRDNNRHAVSSGNTQYTSQKNKTKAEEWKSKKLPSLL